MGSGSMSTAMLGQLDALALLTPEPAPVTQRPSRVPCEACGVPELSPWLHPEFTKKFGHPVCINMQLTYNHIRFALAASHAVDGITQCCYDKHGIHGKAVRKPTREQWLDHARAYIDAAKSRWALHLPSLIGAVGGLRVKYGVTPDEAPVVTEDQFTVHLTSTFPEQPCGYCGKDITTNTGNGGGCEDLPDGRKCRWFICNKCNTKHGWPDLTTHPNLKVES